MLQRHRAISEEDCAKDPTRNRLAVLLSRIDHVSYYLGQIILAPNRSPRALRLVATLSRHGKGKGEGTRGYLHPSSVLHVRFHSPALTGTELSKGAGYAVASAVGLHGINPEVIGCSRHEQAAEKVEVESSLAMTIHRQS